MKNSTINNNYKLLEIRINSFNKIHLNSSFIKDLKLIYYTNNLRFITMFFYKIKKKYLKICTTLYMNFNKRFNSSFYKKLWLYKYLNIYQKLWNFNLKLMFYVKLLNSEFKLTRHPIKKKLIKTLKSPHVFNKSQDHFEIRKHKMSIKLPLLVNNTDSIDSIIEQSINLNPLYKVSIKEKEVFTIHINKTIQ